MQPHLHRCRPLSWAPKFEPLVTAASSRDASCKQPWVSSLACACLALVPASANAYNVRLEDVENPATQSGCCRAPVAQTKTTRKARCLANQTQHVLLLLPEADLRAGVLAATEHRWDDAEKQFRIVLEEDPSSASAWSNLGNVHLSKGRPQEAFRDFSEAIRLAPTVSCIPD